MKRDNFLSDLYLRYCDGTLPKTDLEGGVFLFLLENFDRYKLFNRKSDLWDDFIGWIFPRIKRAIDKYRDLGSSFDAYITGLVHRASREFRCREADHFITESVCWQARAEEMELRETEPEYGEERKEVSMPSDIRPQQILYLALKAYYFISDDLSDRIARSIGMEAGKVRDLISEIRKRRSGRDMVVMRLKEQLFSQHYRCLAYEKIMNSTQTGTEYHEKLKSRYERARLRYRNMNKRLRSVRLNASNRMVAEVLGIPKGTVDSGLFAIKNHLAPFKLQGDSLV